MGNNWTLHVVDPASIARFVDHFLGRTVGGETAFDSLYDVEALYAEIHEAIEREPNEAGRLLLEALAKYASTETPHLSSFAFSLYEWDRFTEEPLTVFPADDVFEEALAEITERYPSLQGNLTIPVMVYGHDGVGDYYPPDLVPELLQKVEQVVDNADPDDLEDFERLLRVLRAAEARGLAYWEVTNLQVANANEDWLSESDNDHGL